MFARRFGLRLRSFSYSRKEEIMMTKSIKRAVIVIITVSIVLCMTLFATRVLANDRSKTETVKTYECYSVQSGDTLWTIAEEHTFGFDTDVKDYIDEILRSNHMSLDNTLQIGQVLVIPVYTNR